MTILRSQRHHEHPEWDENDLHKAGELPEDPTDGCDSMAVASRKVPLPGLELTKSGTTKATRKNVIIALTNHPRWKGSVWFDGFSIQYGLGGKVIDDAVMNGIMVEVGEALGVQFSEKTTKEAVVYLGRQNARHPLAEWLRPLDWDGVPRVDQWLITYLGTADRSLHRRLGVWWLLQAVARPLDPGCQADYTLVLVGAQGVGKSTAARTLAMRSAGFHDTKVRVGDKDALQALQGCWIMELSELSSLKGANVETIKGFLTAREDKFRPPYGRGHEAFPRSSVFIGTTNDGQFLRDQTGNRRFWPVKVGTIDIEALERDREQLWAEAVHRWHAGEARWPTLAEEEELDSHRASFEEEDPWSTALAIWLCGREDSFTLRAAMMGALDLTEVEQKRYANRVGALLRALGYERVRRRLRPQGPRVKVWVKVDR